MLKIENLHKIYGKYHALSGLDMTVKEGALYGFVGPNGAGKTTAIKIMTGLLQAEEGSVLINGKDALADPDQLKSCIGYVPDFFGVYDNLTVGEYMSFFASCYQLDGLVARKRYTALLEQVGLEDKLDFYVDGLSRGMKQRLCLARALIHDPQILILDEPTNHMDIQAKETLESAFQAYEGTILFVSHDRYFIRQVAKSVLIFENNAAFYYPFGYEHYLERKEKEASGEPLAARIKAEEQALIEGLKAVPRAERHRLREIPEEEAYDQWRLRLAAEAIENAAEQVEGLWQQILEKNGKREERELEHWDHPVNEIADKNEDAACGEKQEKQAEEELSAFTEQYENAQSAWTDACLFWYDIWCEAHPEPVMDPGTSDTDGSVPQDTESSKTDGSEI